MRTWRTTQGREVMRFEGNRWKISLGSLIHSMQTGDSPIMEMEWYRGWKIWFDPQYNVYRTERYGVEMNHQDRQALARMIDERKKAG